MTATDIRSVRSVPVARIRMGSDDLRPPFLDEIQRQLQVIEVALRLAQATVEDVGLDQRPVRLINASGSTKAVEAAIAWAEAEQACMAKVFPYRRYGYMSAEFRGAPELLRQHAAAVMEELENDADSRALSEPRIKAVVDEAMSSAERSSSAVKKLVSLSAEIEKVENLHEERSEEWKTPKDPKWQELQSQIEAKVSEVREATGATIAARLGNISAIADTCGGNSIPVIRLRQESPIEVMVALIASAGGLVAVLGQLLDLRVKFKTRDIREEAAQAKLERQLAEDRAVARSCKELRDSLARAQSAELPLRSVAVYDTLESALENSEDDSALN
jgi:hypothetical protein